MKKKDIPIKDRIIFALDVNSKEEAEQWVKRIGTHVNFFKVGLQLFLSEWFSVIDMIRDHGHKVMCDLKLYDIPQTVKLALDQLNNKGISLTTVHGNRSIIKAASDVAKGDLKVLAVTVLTSIGDDEIEETGFNGTIEDLVLKRARNAIEAGCGGIVCSGHEISILRKKLGDDFLIVTPGIRPLYDQKNIKDDQKRVVTPGEAISKGADYIVVGRPISKATDPISVIKSMQDEIRKVL